MNLIKTKELLNTIFVKLIQQTDKEKFNEYKEDFLNLLIAIKFSDTTTMDMQLGMFEKTCVEYINSNFHTDFKELLFGDFQMFLITVDEGLFAE